MPTRGGEAERRSARARERARSPRQRSCQHAKVAKATVGAHAKSASRKMAGANLPCGGWRDEAGGQCGKRWRQSRISLRRALKLAVMGRSVSDTGRPAMPSKRKIILRLLKASCPCDPHTLLSPAWGRAHAADIRFGRAWLLHIAALAGAGTQTPATNCMQQPGKSAVPRRGRGLTPEKEGAQKRKGATTSVASRLPSAIRVRRFGLVGIFRQGRPTRMRDQTYPRFSRRTETSSICHMRMRVLPKLARPIRNECANSERAAKAIRLSFITHAYAERSACERRVQTCRTLPVFCDERALDSHREVMSWRSTIASSSPPNGAVASHHDDVSITTKSCTVRRDPSPGGRLRRAWATDCKSRATVDMPEHRKRQGRLQDHTFGKDIDEGRDASKYVDPLRHPKEPLGRPPNASPANLGFQISRLWPGPPLCTNPVFFTVQPRGEMQGPSERATCTERCPSAPLLG